MGEKRYATKFSGVGYMVIDTLTNAAVVYDLEYASDADNIAIRLNALDDVNRELWGLCKRAADIIDISSGVQLAPDKQAQVRAFCNELREASKNGY